ncbi:MAG: hypothetical protein LUE27_05975 [Clostridia bacterium]|nr:hypothetical protein [Clostridia bacterium]
MTVKDAAKKYLNFQIGTEEYRFVAGESLISVSLEDAVLVSANHVIAAMSRLLDGSISLEELVDWVNVVWFSDAYEFDDSRTDSIVSVMSQLECLDQEGVSFAKDQYLEMIRCLDENLNFPCLYT